MATSMSGQAGMNALKKPIAAAHFHRAQLIQNLNFLKRNVGTLPSQTSKPSTLGPIDVG
jgi:hypothetical protein